MELPYYRGNHLVKPVIRLIERIWPEECLVCHVEGLLLCSDCRQMLLTIKTPTCPFCNRLSSKGSTCKTCQRRYALNGARAVWYYKSPLTEVIQAIKYRKITAPIEILAQTTAAVLTELSRKIDFITSVPSLPRKFNERGFNQSELLAMTVAIKSGVPYRKLLRRKSTKLAQVGLSRAARFKNVADQFASTVTLNGEKILLIDDVITTGATLNACATALKAGGSGSVWALTLAKD